MARRIYGFLIVIAIALAGYVYTIRMEHTKLYITIFMSVIFFILSTGIHGVIAHTLNPKFKEKLIVYPILMGVLWAAFLFFFVNFILPGFYPG